MDCYIICDGSFDHDTKIGAMGGSISIGANTDIAKAEPLTELYDSDDAELHAIYLMLEQIKSDELDKIDNLTIYTDSLNSIRYITGERHVKKGTHRELLVNTIREKLETLTHAQISFTKVKSHVDEKNATDIEKVHNEIDKLVTRQMKNTRDQFRYPKGFVKDQRSIAVYVDRGSCLEKIKETAKLIEDMSGKGYFVSVIADDNYFLDKVAQCINVDNCNAEVYLTEIPEEKKIVNTTPLYQYGMERALIRSFLKTKGVDYEDFITNAGDMVVNASEAAASALLFRNIDFNEGMPQSFISIASPKNKPTINDVGYWINSLSSHLNIRKLKYNKTISRHLGVETGVLPSKEIREQGMSR